MRSFLAGLFLLCICGSALGQAVGFVEKVGFGKRYRPYGWTPMLVNLTSQIGDPAEYQIQVRQEDLDRDRVVFQRDIVLNPNKQEQFWVYFMAQPRGLPGAAVAELTKVLDVRLCTMDGKPLLKLNVQDPIQEIDPPSGGFKTIRDVKMMLLVTDGSSSRAAPSMREFNGAIGLNEDVTPVQVTPYDLPESVIGYDAVDVIIWLDADAAKMTSGGSRRMAAMRDYVREGGRLVVCQPTERFKLEPMADLLPVELKNDAGDWQIELRDRAELEPIRTLATFHTREVSDQVRQLKRAQQVAWDSIAAKGPFKVAFARLREGAVGEEWIDWKGDGKEVSPWIARHAYGLGAVTWVAQDLGNSAITGSRSSGWPYVWDKVLGQRNTDMRVPLETDGKAPYAERARLTYDASGSADLGGSLLRGMDHDSRAGGLIFLAGFFFVAYWVVAGPVSYFVLAGRKRTELSWMIFAASALVATLLTVGVVRLVLRGDAEVHHISVVRMLPVSGRTDDGKPLSRVIVSSRLGVYIPRDYTLGGNRAPVELLGNDPQSLSYVTPFSIHPAHDTSTTDFPAYLEYTVPVRDTPLNEAVLVKFPFRSTLKKLQARWVGELSGGIEIATGAEGSREQNQPRLLPRGDGGYISGKLMNRLGTDLAHVFLAFNFPTEFRGASDEDYVLYCPSWPDGKPLDLGRAFNGAALLQVPDAPRSDARATPGGGNTRNIRGPSIAQWAEVWYSGLGSSGGNDLFDDSKREFLHSFPMLSLYERIRPQENRQGSSNRHEVLRRAARELDVSELVAAGQLVILAQAGSRGVTSSEQPVPFPMEVEGDRVSGSGTTLYQLALPLDRSKLPDPWSDPDAEDAPLTQPAE